MSLTASPFHRVTGELLPGYRDAYLRGDLSNHNTQLVDEYLKANPAKGTEAYQRFHALQATGHRVRPVGWVQQQFDLLRTEPARFRRRVATLVVGTALVSGTVFAGVHGTAPALSGSPEVVGAGSILASPEALAPSVALRTVRGRILDENGRPLAGATVFDKASGRGVGTDAQGRYVLTLPGGTATNLQFGYGGYVEDEARLSGGTTYNVTLLPRPKKAAHRWWAF